MSAWPQVPIKECARVVGGSTPKSETAEYWDGDIPWTTPKDLSDLQGKFIEDTPRKITEAGLKSCSSELLPANSVLFSSRAPIGHVAINSVPMATNQGFKSFIPGPKLDSSFLFWWLKVNRAKLELLGNGATFKEVSKAIVERIEIPLPPLDEQKRIAAILDQADELRRKRKQALDRLNQLGQAIFYEMFGGTNRASWPVLELADVVREGTIVTYGIVQAGDECDGGVPYIRTGDIKDGKIVLDGLRHTAPEIAAKFGRSRVETGEIVMSIRATVGTVAIVPPEIDGANLTQGTARISPGKQTEPWYLIEYLRSSTAQDWIQKQVKGATFREITLGRLRELPVLVPPMALQRQFTEIMDQVEAQISASCKDHRKLDHFFHSLQHRAFRGEL